MLVRAWANEEWDIAAIRKDQFVAHLSRFDKTKTGSIKVADKTIIVGTIFPIFFRTLTQKL